MDVRLAIASRREVREYAPEPLPGDVVERILDAGRLAGSSKNSQPWTLVVPETRQRVERLAGSVFVPANVLDAALVVAVVVRHRRLEVLAQRGRLAQLTAEPAQQADGCLVGHPWQATPEWTFVSP